jgi:hypothetical protein
LSLGLLIPTTTSSLGCTKPNPLYCDLDSECDTGYCEVAIHTCLEPPDAPSTVDSSMALVDADRTPDADTSVPIVQSYQAADLVLGQVNFTSETSFGCIQNSIGPMSVAVANGVLYVHDSGKFRAVAWSPIPSSNFVIPTRVLGKTNFTDCALSDPAEFSRDGFIAAAGARVLVSSRELFRILIWNTVPLTNGEQADLVLGQPALDVTNGPGNGPSQVNSPRGVWTDGTRVLVADMNNSRVLIWTTFPTSNGEPADLVLGQAGFGMGATPATPSQSNLREPWGVWSDGERVVVADTGHNRVLIWNTFPTANGQPADVVLGQPGFTTSTPGLSPDALRGPTGVAGNADALFVADASNDRIVVYSPFPSGNDAATYVLGQPDLVSGANDPAPTPQSLDLPRHLVVAGSSLWVADTNHLRVLRYSLYPE